MREEGYGADARSSLREDGMADWPEQVFTIRIDGPLDAKGSRWEARCEMTATGLQWTLRGNLAKAIRRMME